MSEMFKVTENLAVDLLGHEWVKLTRSKVEVDYESDEPIRKSIRIVAHTHEVIDSKDKYLNLCSEIVSDSLFEGADMKFDRVFYDSCIYLTYHEGRNRLDIILSLGSMEEEDKLALFSDIGDCEIVVTEDESTYKSYSCGVKA